MTARLDYPRIAPGGFKALVGVEMYLAQCGVEHTILHLIKLRISQINGCAYCIDMHWKDLRALGETEQRLYGLDAWRESPYYSAKERAVLAWAESLTRLTEPPHHPAPDDVYEELCKHFSEREVADLTYAVALINAWNRIAIGMRSEPGIYQAKPHSGS